MSPNNWKFLIILALIVLFFIFVYLKNDEPYEFIGISHLIIENEYIFDENRKFGSIGEKYSCKILEEYLGKKIKTNYRPNFLKNPETGRNLELDMYDDEMKIAIEYNGEQHYKYPNKFHKSEKEFVNQVYRDEYKKTICEKEGIFLINIPYYIDEIKKEEIKNLKKLSKKEKNLKIEKLREKKLKEYLMPILNSYFNI